MERGGAPHDKAAKPRTINDYKVALLKLRVGLPPKNAKLEEYEKRWIEATAAAALGAGEPALPAMQTTAWWLGAPAFVALLAVRSLAAATAPIMDCDETFNYWEPLHYLLRGTGMQTWEYSPEFALRVPRTFSGSFGRVTGLTTVTGSQGSPCGTFSRYFPGKVCSGKARCGVRDCQDDNCPAVARPLPARVKLQAVRPGRRQGLRQPRRCGRFERGTVEPWSRTGNRYPAPQRASKPAPQYK